MKIPAEISGVASRLEELREKVVFVGGMIRSVLVTDPGADLGRPTKDVDLIIEVPSQAEYFELVEKLRGRGFRESAEDGAPICRWTVDGITTDIMPIDPAILGFSNVWYVDALQHSTIVTDSNGVIHILDAPRFCATKLEAFASRGNDDFYHRDIEDLIAIVDGRPALLGEIKAAPEDLQTFLSDTVRALLSEPSFVSSLPAHLPPDEGSQARLPGLLSVLEQIASLIVHASELTASPPFFRGGTTPPPSIPIIELGRTYEHIFLRSSNIYLARYDSNEKTLFIEFRNRRTYAYYDVPPTIYSALLQAYSAGRYFNQWVRGRYRYRRI